MPLQILDLNLWLLKTNWLLNSSGHWLHTCISIICNNNNNNNNDNNNNNTNNNNNNNNTVETELMAGHLS